MSRWMNDPNGPILNSNDDFAHPNNSPVQRAAMDSSTFMPSPYQFNGAQFPYQPPLPAGQYNGTIRHTSPPSHNPVYHTNSLVPAKRPLPREDGHEKSPTQNTAIPPLSRTGTPPHSTYASYPHPSALPAPNGVQLSPFLLTQNGCAAATSSPVIVNKIRPGIVPPPQRVSSASPHQFSPNLSQFPSQGRAGPQGSPVLSEYGASQQNHFPHGLSQSLNTEGFSISSQSTAHLIPGHIPPGQLGPTPGPAYPQPHQSAHNDVLDQKKLAYSMRLQQQQRHRYEQPQLQNQPPYNNVQMPGTPAHAPYVAQARQHQLQAHNSIQGHGALPAQQVDAVNGQQPSGSAPPHQRPHHRIDPEQFAKGLAAFMTSRCLPVELNPVVANEPVVLASLFQAVQQRSGYKSVTTGNRWPQIANQLGFQPSRAPHAPSQLKALYERTLLDFEHARAAQVQHRARMQHEMMLTALASSLAGAQSQSPVRPSLPLGQIPHSPNSITHHQAQPQLHLQQPLIQQTALQPPAIGLPPAPPSVYQSNSQSDLIKGFSAPTEPAVSSQFSSPHMGSQDPALRGGLDQTASAIPVGATSSHLPSPALSKVRRSMSLTSNTRVDSVAEVPANAKPGSDTYSPCKRVLETWGGLHPGPLQNLVDELNIWMPNVPHVSELGNIDIQALTRSLQSGLPGEVRLALDTLATTTIASHVKYFLALTRCGELMEALVDCAEEQVDLLVENTVQISDEVQLTSYEALVRACHLERYNVRHITILDTMEHDLDRAADRLTAVITIFRNLSFPPGDPHDNHRALADAAVIKLLCVIIRYLGTRNMLLRTQLNTLDFMKDLVILLSNISGSIQLSSREQALCLLHFLLAFSPTPSAAISDSGPLFFSTYDPNLHPYLPAALDALAKLLARDVPNRSFYRAIFAADANSPIPYETLTSAFAFAVSPIPDVTAQTVRVRQSVIESRKPFLMQGLLVADILASMAPDYDSGLAKTWLTAGGCFAPHILQFIRLLGLQYDDSPRIAAARHAPPQEDAELLFVLTSAISMLRTLAAKARDPTFPTASIPSAALPSSSYLLEIMNMKQPGWTRDKALSQLVAISGLDE